MTPQEFAAWTRPTMRSVTHIQSDACFHANHPGQWLFYRGGENGQYVHIAPTFIEAGTYTDAIPHIGEAAFVTLYYEQLAAPLSDPDAFMRRLLA